jgi:flavin reductase (DIM6/NTAB) family NADH-FMN oxidoreductase RutF
MAKVKDEIRPITEEGDFLQIQTVDHLHFWVGNAKQAMYYWWKGFRFKPVAYSGLTAAKSVMVEPPRVEESPVSIECKVTEIVQVGNGDAGSGWVVLGEAIYIHVDDQVLLPKYRIDLDMLKPIGRLSGPSYTRTGDRFDLFKEKSQLNPEQ